MSATAKDSYLVDKIALFQCVIFVTICKYTLSLTTRFMKYFLLVLVFPALFGDKCGGNKNVLPVCVQHKIDSIKAEPKWNPPAEVNEYVYNKRHVFLFTSNCCDQFIVLLGGSCNYICAPSGGYTGKGDGKCSDFYEKAKHVKLVWKDDR